MYSPRFYIKDNSKEIFFTPDSETIEACGINIREENRILISLEVADLCYYSGVGGTIGHEIGHVLSGRGGHAPDGILSKTTKDTVLEPSIRLITESSLLQVCQYQDCKEFIPETDWNLVVKKYPYYAGLPD